MTKPRSVSLAERRAEAHGRKGSIMTNGPEINDIDERLLWLLRRAGDEWGPLGVALAAQRLVDAAAEREKTS